MSNITGHLIAAYVELLKIPSTSMWRIENQHVLTSIRDTIAAHTGMNSNEVQDTFEMYIEIMEKSQ